MNDEPVRVTALGGIDGNNIYAMGTIRVAADGRIRVVCPCCKAEGKTDLQALLQTGPIEWEPLP